MASSRDSTPEETTVEEISPEYETHVAVGEYSWADFMQDHGYADAVEETITRIDEDGDGGGLFEGLSLREPQKPDTPHTVVDWDATPFDPVEYLGFHPDEIDGRVGRARAKADHLWDSYKQWIRNTPVAKDEYTWEHFKWEYYYDEDGNRPRTDEGEIEPFEPESHLGFDPETIESRLSAAADAGSFLLDLEEQRTVNVNPDLDEDQFFSTRDGHTTITNRYDLEKAVELEKKLEFEEIDRYWVNKPYAFVIIFHSLKENEKKYYLVEPYINEIEDNLVEFLTGKLRTAIKYSEDEVVIRGSMGERTEVIERETRRLLDQYAIYPESESLFETVFDRGKGLLGLQNGESPEEPSNGIEGIEARPEPVVLAEDPDTITQYQVEKLLYLLTRNFIGYGRIDGIKHDINVEDVSCDGYNSRVFVYHTDYENIITNISHGKTELDNFVVKLAQRAGKGISKRRPQVDATLDDGSRAQLTLGREVSDHGTNYTIRQFNDIPFTPIDLINWNTFSLDEMAFLWLCIENNKSLIFSGGTASGKTTSLNAVSLFIPSNAKIVSIEDTREVELPQRNWVASITRPSFTEDGKGDIDEFDLLEAALRQRPDYIVMGEVRGEEGRTLFQVMSTGHTTLTTFHADNVGEVLKRFTTDPINVSKTMFTAVDLVSVQTQTRVRGQKVRRNKVITEINHFDAENDEINVQDVFQWRPESDEHSQQVRPNILEDIQFDQGWSRTETREQLFKRKVVLAYLIDNDLNEYAKVAATLQAFINDPETILTLIAKGRLKGSLDDLQNMESVLINQHPEKEKLVPRPEPTPETEELAEEILAEAEDRLFEEYREKELTPLISALPSADEVEDITVTPETGQQLLEQNLGQGDAEVPNPIQERGDEEAVDTAQSASGPEDGGETVDEPVANGGTDSEPSETDEQTEP